MPGRTHVVARGVDVKAKPPDVSRLFVGLPIVASANKSWTLMFDLGSGFWNLNLPKRATQAVAMVTHLGCYKPVLWNYKTRLKKVFLVFNNLMNFA